MQVSTCDVVQIRMSPGRTSFCLTGSLWCPVSMYFWKLGPNVHWCMPGRHWPSNGFPPPSNRASEVKRVQSLCNVAPCIQCLSAQSTTPAGLIRGRSRHMLPYRFGNSAQRGQPGRGGNCSTCRVAFEVRLAPLVTFRTFRWRDSQAGTETRVGMESRLSRPTARSTTAFRRLGLLG